jgi:hypothetical protein
MKKHMLSGTLTMVYPDNHTEPCIIECKAKKGVGGLMLEILKLAAALKDMDAPPIPTEYHGDCEIEIRIEYAKWFEKAKGIVRS